MKILSSNRILTILAISFAMMVPSVAMAQSDGGKKKKKRAKTEQIQNANRRKVDAELKRKAEEQRLREAEAQKEKEAEEKRQRELEEQRQREAEELSKHEVKEKNLLKKQQEEEIYVQVEQIAEFPGGQNAFIQWLAKSIRYPENAIKHNIQGRVIIKCVIEKDGSISNETVIRSVDNDLDNEALRIVKSMPKWQPGKMNGEAVRSYVNLPFTFRL